MVNCMQVNYISIKLLTKETEQSDSEGNRVESMSCNSYNIFYYTTDLHFRKCFKQSCYACPILERADRAQHHINLGFQIFLKEAYHVLDKFYLQKEVKKMTSLFFPVTDVAKYRKHLRDMTIGTLKRLLVLFWGWGWGCFLKKKFFIYFLLTFAFSDLPHTFPC